MRPRDNPLLEVPKQLDNIWKPFRHKAIHGGRGGTKSHTMAGVLVTKGVERPLRVGCYREIQKSIGTSVKRLLDDKIDALGLRGAYHSTEYKIVGPNGTEFLFGGLRTNAESIKSTEGLDVAWIEEANTVSQASLELLKPTVRKDDSELWYGWNRKHATDPVDDMFLNPNHPPPPRSWVQRINWRHNPWFPQVLIDEMEYDKKRDFDKYLHVWEGQLLQRSAARVFNNWTMDDLDDEIEELGITPRLGADWGFANDPNVVIELYVVPEKRLIYIKNEVYKVKCEIDETPAFMAGTDTRGPEDARWTNTHNHPGLKAVRDGHRIVADSARPELISYLRHRGFNIIKAKKGPNSIEEGVEFLKTFDIVIHPRCTRSEAEFTHYSYKVDKLTDEVLPELADKHNHLIDAARYALEDIRLRQAGTGLATFIPEAIKSQC